jgi:hypothetical protein
MAPYIQLLKKVEQKIFKYSTFKKVEQKIFKYFPKVLVIFAELFIKILGGFDKLFLKVYKMLF